MSERAAELSKQAKKLESSKQKMDAERIDAHHSYEKQSGELEQFESKQKSYQHKLAALRLHNLTDLDSIAHGLSAGRIYI
jgi:hypothetical protein